MYFLLINRDKKTVATDSRLRFLEGSRKCNCFFCSQPYSVCRFRQFSAFLRVLLSRCVVGYFTKAKRCTQKGHDPTTRKLKSSTGFLRNCSLIPFRIKSAFSRSENCLSQSRVSCRLLCLCVCVCAFWVGGCGGRGWGWSSQNFRARTYDDALQGHFQGFYNIFDDFTPFWVLSRRF